MARQDATVDEIKIRIRAIAELLSDIKTVEPQPPSAPDASGLWAIMVEDGEADRGKLTLSRFWERREFVVWLFIELLPRNYTPAQEDAAVEAAAAYMRRLPAHFALYPRLQLSGDGGIVARAEPMRDDGVKIVPLRDKFTYSAIRYLLPVTTYFTAG